MNELLNQKQRNEIGFEYVLEKLKVSSSYGRQLLVSQKPFLDESLLIEEFNKIESVKEYVNNYPKDMNESEVYFARIKNIDNILDSLDYVCLDEVDIFEIKKFVFNVIKLANKFANIDDILNDFLFFDFSELFAYLDQDGSKMPFFTLYDQYSAKLTDLRIRYQDSSLNDSEKAKLKDAINEEQQEVRIIISREIAKYQKELIKTTKQIAYLDLLIAKAKLALEYNLAKPQISNNIELIDSYNPYIKEIVETKGYSYIPLNIKLEKKIQLVTGSNMAGKSVTLKNIILNTLCFQYGIYPFALKASLPLVDFIIYISDELQDVENSLSSFGKEIAVLNEALAMIENKQGLIVLDEFAQGTNPIEAKMISVGLCKYLNEKNCYCLLATHLDLNLEIDYIHYQVVGLSNCDDDCLSSEDIQRVMDYSLKRVSKETKVPNDAFKVMNFLKINDDLKKKIEEEYKKEIENGQN